MILSELLAARIVPHALSKTSLTFGFFSIPISPIKDMTSTITDVPAVTVCEIGTPEYQEVVLRALVSRFLCLVKLPL